MDSITIKSLSFRGKHGFYDEEQSAGNHFEVDVQAEGDFKKSVDNDDLSSTFNYELAESVAREVFAGPSERLIEALCIKIGDRLIEKSNNTKQLTVTVRKLNPPLQTKAEYAEITMKWKR